MSKVSEPMMLMEPIRKSNSQVAEDMGLFQTGMTRAQVAMAPIFGQNSRGDWVISSVLPDGKEFQVVFAGRRAASVDELRAELSQAWSSAVRSAAAQRQNRPEPHTVTIPVLIEGSWRAVFRRDGAGWETRQYQLYAARWTFARRDGEIEVAGEAPQFEGDVTLSTVSHPGVPQLANSATQ
ncbi:MAG: hypothetical protein ABJD13_19985 [Paracoccaceae bacterium]